MRDACDEAGVIEHAWDFEQNKKPPRDEACRLIVKYGCLVGLNSFTDC
jgi:hypothetical protein